MIKLLKEMFSSENLKKAMVTNLYFNPSLTAQDYLRLANLYKDITEKNITKEIQTKKAA